MRTLAYRRRGRVVLSTEVWQVGSNENHGLLRRLHVAIAGGSYFFNRTIIRSSISNLFTHLNRELSAHFAETANFPRPLIRNTTRYVLHGASIKLFRDRRLTKKKNFSPLRFLSSVIARKARLGSHDRLPTRARSGARRSSCVVTANDIIYSRLD